MDLSSLLNNQKEISLSLTDLEQLLSKCDSEATLDRIRTTTAYAYPSNERETFRYFDTFIQVILSIDQDEDLYNKQYSKSIIIDALRNCINGLLKQNGLAWLLQFSRQFTTKTWIELRNNLTILVYLYGLVLALLNKPDISNDPAEWIQSILPFIRSNSPVVMAHLWLNCCCSLAEEEENPVLNQTIAKAAYLKALEIGFNQPNHLSLEQATSLPAMENELNQHKVPSFMDMLTILKEANTVLLASSVDQQLGNALARPPFSKDELTVGYMCLEAACEKKPTRFISTTKVYNNFKCNLAKINSISSPRNDTISNPLFNQQLLAQTPSDIYDQTEAIRQGTRFWVQKMSELTPQDFDMHLKNVIEEHYPTERKTVLDLVLADWTARDRFHRHMDLVVHTLLSQLSKTKKYNKRTAPYYAFTQQFNIPDENYQRYQLQQQQRQTNVSMLNTSSSSYQVKSGAYIDLSRFSNCSDMVLMHGCSALLQSMTLFPQGSANVEEWVADCLKFSCSEIIQQYTFWLVTGLEKESSLRYSQYMQVLLKNCISSSSYVVPILLKSFSQTSLTWLLKKNPQSASIILHYFDDGQQVSKDLLVVELLKSKEKDYINMLMNYLRENMSCTDPTLPRSRAWFRNHFLANILSLVGEDTHGQSVASCIFRQLLKTRDDFEWYFGTPLVPAQQITFKTLHLTNAHDIYAVKNTGLAAMLEAIARMKDNGTKERLINDWFDLWTSTNNNEYKFTVPVGWILQCAGLYDQAPVVVKLMIKRFIHIGISHQQQQTPEQDIMRLVPERNFLDRVMDLILLSDTPEPDRLFEFVLSLSCEQYGVLNTFQDINRAIISTMIELDSELNLENLALSSTNQMPPPPPKPKIYKRRKDGKYHKKSRRQQAAMIRKHEEELEKYLKESSENVIKINNTMKALTTLTQRIFNFLALLFNNTCSPSTVESTSNILPLKERMQLELTSTLLLYYPLAKLVKLIREPEDLLDDIQTVIDLCLERLKNHPTNKELHGQAQKVLSNI